MRVLRFIDENAKNFNLHIKVLNHRFFRLKGHNKNIVKLKTCGNFQLIILPVAYAIKFI